MWEYFTKENHEEYILSLNLIDEDWSKDKIIRCLYSLSNHSERHYKKLEIKKHDGSSREILSPDYILKKVQTNLLTNVLNDIPISKCATAYHKGANIIDNALPHLDQKIILKMDIKNFFNNIDFTMIYNKVFSNVYYPPSVKTLLVNLCCYYDYLPQGAPTSAAISNIVMKPFDDYISAWCEKKLINYTRYCDDMTFSGDFDVAHVKNKITSLLETMEFEVNTKKTQTLSRNKRQIVTGVVVNEKIQTSKTYRKKIRQEIYYCQKYGVQSHLSKTNRTEKIDRYLRSLLGKINFVLNVNPDDSEFINAREFVFKELEHVK